jgi:hypothetical protein
LRRLACGTFVASARRALRRECGFTSRHVASRLYRRSMSLLQVHGNDVAIAGANTPRERHAPRTKVPLGVTPCRPARLRRTLLSNVKLKQQVQEPTLGLEGRLAPVKRPYPAAASNGRV